MAICIECGTDALSYQTVITKRGTTVHVCDNCIKKRQRKGATNENKDQRNT